MRHASSIPLHKSADMRALRRWSNAEKFPLWSVSVAINRRKPSKVPVPFQFLETINKMRKLNDFWTITVDDAAMQWHTFALQSKGDCFLSANTKLVGVDKAVLLSSKNLAHLFCNALTETLRRRHGDSVRATVVSIQTTEAGVDDLLVRARIEEALFAPNKRPSSLSASAPAHQQNTKF